MDLKSLQPLFKFSSMSLTETNPGTAEKALIQTMVDLFQAQHVGAYVRPVGAKAFQWIAGQGSLPEQQDPFWSTAEIGRASQAREMQFMASCCDDPSNQDLLQERGWGSLLIAACPRRKDVYLFMVARDTGSAVFTQPDLDLLVVLARQASVTLENVRLFSALAGLAQRVERSNGILQQAERMGVIENVIPSLSRDLTSPIQSIKNSLYLAGRPENRGDKLGYYLTLAQKELFKVEGILARMVALSQPVCLDPAAIEVEPLVKEVLDSLAARFREQNVQVRANYARPLPVVHCSRDQLELVLYVLFMNAVDAMSEIAGDKVIWIDTVSEGDSLRLSVEDSGPGFPPGAGESLFKPFQTTKPEGSGIGLVVSQRIIAGHGGKLSRRPSRHENGACMEIELPCGDKH